MRREPYEGKLSRTVLGGVEGSNVLRLLDYVSCERVFQPRYEGRPVVVLSNNDGNVRLVACELTKQAFFSSG